MVYVIAWIVLFVTDAPNVTRHIQQTGVNSAPQHLQDIYLNIDSASVKLLEEVRLGRIAGPFTSPPFIDMYISPMSTVPKKEVGTV